MNRAVDTKTGNIDGVLQYGTEWYGMVWYGIGRI